MMKRILLCTTPMLLALSPGIRAADPAAKPKYTIEAIRYATLHDYKVSSLVKGADPSRRQDIAMMVWLVRGGGKNILVDSGFYREANFKKPNYDIRDFIKPSDAVARAGVKPEDITDVIITHIHWDHADGADLFPKARIWLQRDEYNYYVGEAWQGTGRRPAMDKEDVISYVNMNMDGRVSFVEGDGKEIIPGITCYTGGKHTYASQFVGVNTAQGTVILTSDNVYMYENLEKHAPITSTLDADSNLRAQDRMRTLAARESLIIPGHDPAVFVRFQGDVPGIVRIQ